MWGIDLPQTPPLLTQGVFLSKFLLPLEYGRENGKENAQPPWELPLIYT